MLWRFTPKHNNFSSVNFCALCASVVKHFSFLCRLVKGHLGVPVAPQFPEFQGARGLRAIIEDIMLNVMYDVPSRTDVTKCIVTRDVITKLEDPLLVTAERKRKEETA